MRTLVVSVSKAASVAAASTAGHAKPLVRRKVKLGSGDSTVKIRRRSNGKRFKPGRYRLSFIEIYNGTRSKKVSHPVVVKP